MNDTEVRHTAALLLDASRNAEGELLHGWRVSEHALRLGQQQIVNLAMLCDWDRVRIYAYAARAIESVGVRAVLHRDKERAS